MCVGVERFCDFVLKKGGGGILGFELKNECWKDKFLEGEKIINIVKIK
jgi:hypothetical protein